jgi:hypothetical protein
VDNERSARMYEGPSVLGKTMEPAPDLRVEHPRQIFNGLAAAQMQLPVPNLRPHRLARLVCDCRTEVADGPPLFCDRRGRNVYPRTLKPHAPRLTKHATSP